MYLAPRISQGIRHKVYCKEENNLLGKTGHKLKMCELKICLIKKTILSVTGMIETRSIRDIPGRSNQSAPSCQWECLLRCDWLQEQLYVDQHPGGKGHTGREAILGKVWRWSADHAWATKGEDHSSLAQSRLIWKTLAGELGRGQTVWVGARQHPLNSSGFNRAAEGDAWFKSKWSVGKWHWSLEVKVKTGRSGRPRREREVGLFWGGGEWWA